MQRPCAQIHPDGLPQWIKAQLIRLLDEAPDGVDWLHDIKFDGYRIHARLDRGKVRLLARTGLDWTNKCPMIAVAVSSLPLRQAYLDGELCGVRPDGTTSFSIMRNVSDTGNTDALIFFLFDLLHLDGEERRPGFFRRCVGFRRARTSYEQRTFCHPITALGARAWRRHRYGLRPAAIGDYSPNTGWLDRSRSSRGRDEHE